MGGSKMKGGKSQAPTGHIKKFFAEAKKRAAAAKEGSSKKNGSRLYVKGVIAGYRRALTKQQNHTSLIKIQGVEDTNDVKFYLGKRIMYMYRAKTEKDGTRFRVMWGMCVPLMAPVVLSVPSSVRTFPAMP